MPSSCNTTAAPRDMAHSPTALPNTCQIQSLKEKLLLVRPRSRARALEGRQSKKAIPWQVQHLHGEMRFPSPMKIHKVSAFESTTAGWLKTRENFLSQWMCPLPLSWLLVVASHPWTSLACGHITESLPRSSQVLPPVSVSFLLLMGPSYSRMITS